MHKSPRALCDYPKWVQTQISALLGNPKGPEEAWAALTPAEKAGYLTAVQARHVRDGAFITSLLVELVPSGKRNSTAAQPVSVSS